MHVFINAGMYFFFQASMEPVRIRFFFLFFFFFFFLFFFLAESLAASPDTVKYAGRQCAYALSDQGFC